MISPRQAGLAAIEFGAYIEQTRTRVAHVSPELVRLATESAMSAPDVRPDRVAQARARLEHSAPDAKAIAESMVARIVGDSVR